MNVWVEKLYLYLVLPFSGCFGFLGLPLVYLGILNTLRVSWIYFIQSIDSYSSSQDVLKAYFLIFFNFTENNRLATKNSY